MLRLLIVAPQEGFQHHVPAGFIFADEVFTEANLKDSISSAQSLTAELQRALVYLARRYPRRIRLRWLDLWSPAGLWLVFRFRLRSFPAVIVNNQQVLSGDQLLFQPLTEHIGALLSQSQAPNS